MILIILILLVLVLVTVLWNLRTSVALKRSVEALAEKFTSLDDTINRIKPGPKVEKLSTIQKITEGMSNLKQPPSNGHVGCVIEEISGKIVDLNGAYTS
jgi:predicted Holliday junction resolvase-like endonuclease